MICARCLLRAVGRPRAAARPFSTTSRRDVRGTPVGAQQQALSSDQAAQSTPQRSPPAATSTAAAQPFSAGQTPSKGPAPASDPKAGPSTAATTTQHQQGVGARQARAPPAVVSSVPEGTPLLGINYFKDKGDPVALADNEYPPWLWTVLGEPKKKDALPGASKGAMDAKLFAKSAGVRRAARRRARANGDPEAVTHQTPVYEQSVDLPATAVEGGEARHELQRMMRLKRRGDIKTTNFLKTMR